MSPPSVHHLWKELCRPTDRLHFPHGDLLLHTAFRQLPHTLHSCKMQWDLLPQAHQSGCGSAHKFSGIHRHLHISLQAHLSTHGISPDILRFPAMHQRSL